MRALMWFRADLRTADNTALHDAVRDADRGVVGVFIVSPAQWAEHDWGSPKAAFVVRGVRSLSERLERLNIPLRILTVGRFAGVPRALVRLAEETGCDALYLNREYEVNERRRDDAVRAAFERSGRKVHEYTDQTILAPGEVLTKDGSYFTVFTPFRRAALRVLGARGVPPVTVRPAPRKQAELPCAPDPIPERAGSFDLAAGRPDLWPAGETHALSRLRTFTDRRIARYKEDRDLPALNSTSTLSPYLAAGVVSPRQCLRAAAEANDGLLDGGSPGADQWITELLWRDFYKHLLVAFPRLSMGRAFKPETERLRWRDAPGDLAAWQAGRTGVPIIDAAMRQLAQTGWMHNRLRMITAMYLTKDLFISWREGERFFMQSLVDGDLASNNGGWQWSASTGTDAAPYFRIFNPVSQSRRCDPQGAFIRRFLPELTDLDARAIHEPWSVPDPHALRGYPRRSITDHAEARGRFLAAFRALR